jgi:hypothetical protein
MKRLLPVFLLFLITACPPPIMSYAPATNNTSGGYRDKILSPNHYEIQVIGRREGDEMVLQQHFDRRSAELCNSKYKVVNLRKDKYEYLSDTYILFSPRASSIHPYITGEVICNTIK